MAKSRLTPDYIEWVLTLNADQAAKEMHKVNDENRELAKQQDAARQAMAKLEAEGKKGTKEWQNLKKSVKEYGEQIKTNNEKLKELDKRLDLNQKSAAELSKKLKKLKKELDNTSKATNPTRYKELEQQINATGKALTQATSGTNIFGRALQGMSKLGTVIQGFFLGIGQQLLLQVVQKFKEAANVIIDFEKANSKLAGILQSSKGDIQDLTNEARRLGETTAYSASEVTALQVELAKLGFSKGEIKQMEDAVLKFALAVDTDLASASQVAGGALRAFGLDASQTENALATLAIGTTTSALSFNDYATMLSTTAPVAKAFGFTLEDTVALMGALKNANFDASSAATATRNILLNLADSNGALARALGQPVTNLDELAAGLQKLQQEGIDLATALELTDKRSVAAFETFINNAGTLKSLRAGVTNCTDAFNSMYKEMGDNVQGSINILKSTFEGLVLEFYNGKGALKLLVDTATLFLNIVKGVITFIKEHTRLMAVATATWVAYYTAVNWATIKQVAYKVATLAANTAQKLLNVSMSMNPVGALAAGITLLVTGLIALVSYLNEATEAQKAQNEAEKEALSNYTQQENKINRLIAVAKNENISMKQRLAACKELNKIVPKYNANIDASTGKYKAATEQLNLYLEALKKEMLYKSYMKQREKLVDAQIEAEMNLIEETKKVEDNRRQHNAQVGNRMVTSSTGTGPGSAIGANQYYAEGQYGQAALNNAQKKLNAATKAVTDFDHMVDEKIKSGEILVTGSADAFKDASDEAADAAHNVGNAVDKTNNSLSTTVDRLKEIDAELKKLRKADPQTDEEYQQIQDRIKALTDERKKLQGKGGGKKTKKGTTKHEVGTYKEDSIEEVTAPIDLKHQQNMLGINKRKDELTEAELIIEKSKEIIRYEQEVQAALANLAAGTDASHTQTLDKIKKEQAQSEANVLAAQEAINSAKVSQDENYYKKRLEAVKAFYDTQTDLITEAKLKGEITDEQAEIYRLNQTRQFHADELKEMQRHFDELEDADYYTAEQRRSIQTALLNEMAAKNRQILQDAAAMQAKYRNMTADPIGLKGLQQNLDMEIAAVNAAYNAMIEMARQNGLDTVELERQRLAKIRELNYQHAEKLYGIQEQIGTSWADEYRHELDQLQKLKDDELITEKEYGRRKLDLLLGNIKKYFDYYSGLSSSMFSAIQQAEIDQNEAKYDELIRQAENNGEDTAALEEEKENKKLEIQKKYADVDFAIKISQIIADTAVSVMKAYAQLGPIAGVIAAAMMTATGVAQVISAKAERDKIKNLQPKSSASKVGTAERVVSGYSDGGYTGDGGRYEVAGVVHRGEYVVPKPIMNDPRVVDAVGTIEAIRRKQVIAGNGTTPAAAAYGYANGGHTGTGELAAVASELRAATEAVKQMRAYIVYQDIEKAGEVLDKARDTFTNN